MTARILVVDDVPANARLLEAKLTAEYYQVASARDGFAAIETALAWQPDLILLDVMMPGMDGFDCCRRLKEQERTAHIPVVMVTALGAPAERIQGLEAGADDFLTKPVEFDTLMARVRSLVRLKRLSDAWRTRGESTRALSFTAGREAAPRVEGARALVVDDWNLGARAVQAALERDGVTCVRATSITEAIGRAAGGGFELIVLSLSLAGQDALQFVSALRAAESTREIPLLLLAEPEQRDRLLRGLDMGANDWLLMPLDETELRVRARGQIRRKLLQDRLRADLGRAMDMAMIDRLTGLFNRRYLTRHLRGLMEGGPQQHVAVLLLDIDGFKAINRAYGHAAGDRALQALARVLRANTRLGDSVARCGGEEFCVVMPDTGPDEAAMAGERLRAAVEALRLDPADDAGHDRQMTVSVGTACAVPGRWTAERLLGEADRALDQAKGAGRNRVVEARGT